MPVVAAVVATAATVASIGYGVAASRKQAQMAEEQAGKLKEWGAAEIEEIQRVGEKQREQYSEAAARFKERQSVQAGATGFRRESGSIQQIFRRTEQKISEDIAELKAQEEAAIERVGYQTEIGVMSAEAAAFAAKGQMVQTLLGGLQQIGTIVGAFNFSPKRGAEDYGYGGGYYGTTTSTGPAWTPAMYGGVV